MGASDAPCRLSPPLSPPSSLPQQSPPVSLGFPISLLSLPSIPAWSTLPSPCRRHAASLAPTSEAQGPWREAGAGGLTARSRSLRTQHRIFQFRRRRSHATLPTPSNTVLIGKFVPTHATQNTRCKYLAASPVADARRVTPREFRCRHVAHRTLLLHLLRLSPDIASS